MLSYQMDWPNAARAWSLVMVSSFTKQVFLRSGLRPLPAGAAAHGPMVEETIAPYRLQAQPGSPKNARLPRVKHQLAA
ncbi:hypothetical protein TDMWS_11420 [Thermodesulfomicrobium sp. WS]|nr:hypothetical protein TDMWS_11420 [Thermodesulfomicrobium sp. WS]